MRICFVLLVMNLFGVVSPATARPIITYPYTEFAEKADLIVIAQTLESTQETGENDILPGFIVRGPDGNEGPMEGMRLETRFKLLAVLKGIETSDVFTLHHYSLGSNKCTNCFANPRFDPNDVSKSDTFLMFLKKESDGQYTPALDIVDITKSISPLPRENFPLPPPPPRSQ